MSLIICAYKSALVESYVKDTDVTFVCPVQGSAKSVILTHVAVSQSANLRAVLSVSRYDILQSEAVGQEMEVYKPTAAVVEQLVKTQPVLPSRRVTVPEEHVAVSQSAKLRAVLSVSRYDILQSEAVGQEMEVYVPTASVVEQLVRTQPVLPSRRVTVPVEQVASSQSANLRSSLVPPS